MFTFAEVKERREKKKKKTFLGTEEEFGDRRGFFREVVSKKSFQEFSREISRACTTRTRGGSRPRRRRDPRTCFTRAHFGIDAGSKGIVQCLQSAGDRDR